VSDSSKFLLKTGAGAAESNTGDSFSPGGGASFWEEEEDDAKNCEGTRGFLRYPATAKEVSD
jgi:hypothetical protein